MRRSISTPASSSAPAAEDFPGGPAGTRRGFSRADPIEREVVDRLREPPRDILQHLSLPPLLRSLLPALRRASASSFAFVGAANDDDGPELDDTWADEDASPYKSSRPPAIRLMRGAAA